MPGVKGQLQAVSRPDTLREKAWQVIRQRAGQGFTASDLMVAVPNLKQSNVNKWLPTLRRHGFIRECGKFKWTKGIITKYAIARESRNHPIVCDRCGKAVTATVCENAG